MDKYTIIEQVGAGTFGAVYKARTKRNEIVALKKMYVQNNEEGISYFALQEIKYLTQLSGSKNIVALLDSFIHTDTEKEGGKSCVVMVLPYYELDLVGARNAFDGVREVKCAMQQLLEGLHAMHSRHLMHRDIKPANLLMRNGEIVIADMGMTTNWTVNHNPFPCQVVTLWYRPLELLFGSDSYGGEVDVWSAGLCFVELMTKSCPFQGQTEHHQVELILRILGTNYIEESPELKKLPFFEKLLPKTNLPKTSQLKQIFSSWNADALDLLSKMLCPAHQRLSVVELLAHPFFSKHPRACLPSEIRKIPAMHEFQLRQIQRRKREDDIHTSNTRQCASRPNQGKNLTAKMVTAEEKSNWGATI